MKTADNFCIILLLLTYPVHSAQQDWLDRKKMVLNSFGHCLFFFSPVFYSCWFAKSQVAELWVVCPTAPLFWSVLLQKLEKPVHLLFFFFHLPPIGSCSLSTCRQGGAYLSCGKLPYKNRLYFPLSQSFSRLIQALVDPPWPKLHLFSMKCV